MIDGDRRGPYELYELAKAGVCPDTYVWCKGMADWEKAEDVADICRHFRRTVYDRTHSSHFTPSQPHIQEPRRAETDSEDPYGNVPLRFREMLRKSGVEAPVPTDDSPDIDRAPSPTIFLSFVVMLFCFPITGAVALYYSFKARSSWTEAMRSQSKGNKDLYDEKERRQLRASAHDYDRQARMWIGITFFLGLIFYAFISHKYL